MRIRAALALALAVVAAAPAAAQLDAEAARGQKIYRHGLSDHGGEITAVIGDDRIGVPASALPCANCHGLDGRGRPEGGVSPSDLTWPALTRPYGVRHASGREHPPYDRAALARAITMGIDPAGNALHVAMPRYRMTHGDLDALLAYLRTIGSERDPGVLDDAVVLGQLLPPDGALERMGAALEGVVAERLRRENEAGGIYGRTLRLETLALPAEPAARPAAVARFVRERSVFALLPSFLAGADAEIAGLAAELEVPMIAPLTLRAAEHFPVNRQVFHLWTGIAGQGRALARFAAGAGAGAGAARAAVLADPTLASAAAAIVEELGPDAAVEIVELADADRHARTGDRELAARLAAEGVEDLFLLAAGPAASAFLAAAGATGWHPRVLVPGSLAGRAVLDAASGGDSGGGGALVVAYPTVPADRLGAPAAELEAMRAALGLGRGGGTVARAALAGTELLIEGLQRAGRELSRERLIAALEGLYDHPTGLSPPLTFGPNRRVGARGAYVVTVADGGRARAEGGWVAIER